MSAGKAAVFLDRDGVINREKNYVHRVDEFEFLDGVFEACRRIRRAGYRLVIITNQAGIARGYYTEADYHALTRWMLDCFRAQGVEVDAVYFCPHHPEHGLGDYRRECGCRKPAPGMILDAAREHGLDLSRSILVGDKLSDIQAGKAAGIGSCILVLSGHSAGSAARSEADAVYQDLNQAADAFLENRNE